MDKTIERLERQLEEAKEKVILAKNLQGYFPELPSSVITHHGAKSEYKYAVSMQVGTLDKLREIVNKFPPLWAKEWVDTFYQFHSIDYMEQADKHPPENVGASGRTSLLIMAESRISSVSWIANFAGVRIKFKTDDLHGLKLPKTHEEEERDHQKRVIGRYLCLRPSLPNAHRKQVAGGYFYLTYTSVDDVFVDLASMN